MIESPRALRIPVSDLALARWWYTEAFGIEASEVREDAVQFHVNGFAVLLTPGVPSADAPTVYWGVADVQGERARLLALQQNGEQALQTLDSEDDAVVRDPFGNPFGLTSLGDADIRRARSQRSAEKIALRNVRGVLDDFQQKESQRSREIRSLLLAGLVMLVLMVLLFAGIARYQAYKRAAQTLTVPALEKAR